MALPEQRQLPDERAMPQDATFTGTQTGSGYGPTGEDEGLSVLEAIMSSPLVRAPVSGVEKLFEGPLSFMSPPGANEAIIDHFAGGMEWPEWLDPSVAEAIDAVSQVVTPALGVGMRLPREVGRAIWSRGMDEETIREVSEGLSRVTSKQAKKFHAGTANTTDEVRSVIMERTGNPVLADIGESIYQSKSRQVLNHPDVDTFRDIVTIAEDVDSGILRSAEHIWERRINYDRSPSARFDPKGEAPSVGKRKEVEGGFMNRSRTMEMLEQGAEPEHFVEARDVIKDITQEHLRKIGAPDKILLYRGGGRIGRNITALTPDYVIAKNFGHTKAFLVDREDIIYAPNAFGPTEGQIFGYEQEFLVRSDKLQNPEFDVPIDVVLEKQKPPRGFEDVEVIGDPRGTGTYPSDMGTLDLKALEQELQPSELPKGSVDNWDDAPWNQELPEGHWPDSELHVTDIPPGTKGVSEAAQFMYDLNKATGKDFAVPKGYLGHLEPEVLEKFKASMLASYLPDADPSSWGISEKTWQQVKISLGKWKASN